MSGCGDKRESCDCWRTGPYIIMGGSVPIPEAVLACRQAPPDTCEQIAEKRRRQRDDARDERDEARKELKECRRERDCLRKKLIKCQWDAANWGNTAGCRPTPLELAQADEIKRLRANCNGFFDAAHEAGRQCEQLRRENAELAERNTAINEMLAKAEHKAEQAEAERDHLRNWVDRLTASFDKLGEHFDKRKDWGLYVKAANYDAMLGLVTRIRDARRQGPPQGGDT